MHARELVLQVYRFAAGKGVEVDNPAEALARKASATFVPRVRTASARARVCAAPLTISASLYTASG